MSFQDLVNRRAALSQVLGVDVSVDDMREVPYFTMALLGATVEDHKDSPIGRAIAPVMNGATYADLVLNAVILMKAALDIPDDVKDGDDRIPLITALFFIDGIRHELVKESK